jgi:hypothetical protein
MSGITRWRDMRDKALQSPYLLLLFIASVLLSIASFYTTFVGIVPFVQIAIFGFFITAAIQSLLFVVSWRLGFMFAGKEDVATVDVMVFLVTFTLSVFFSFNSLFNVVFAEDLQREASLSRVRDGASAAVNQAQQTLQRAADARADAVRSSDAYVAWRADVLAIADLATQAGPAVADLLRQQRTVQQTEFERLASAARDLAAREGTLETEIETSKQRLALLNSRRPGDVDAVAELEAQAHALESEAAQKRAARDAEEKGIGDTGRGGCGPVCKKLDLEWRQTAAKHESVLQQLNIARGRLGSLDAEIAKVTEQLRRDEALFKDIDTQIASAEQVAREARERAAAMGQSGGVSASVEQLREYPKRFEQTGDPSHLVQAEILCTQLADNMQALDTLTDQLGKLSCDRGPFAPLVAELTDSRRSLAEMERQCTGPAAPSFYDMDVGGALSAARACLDLTKLPFKEIRAERNELDRLEREEGPNASEFTKTVNALLAGEKLAIFALVIAAAMDLLVLFTGLIGAKSATSTFAVQVFEARDHEPPNIRATKILLRHVRQFVEKGDDGLLYRGKVDLEEIADDDQRALVEPLLHRNANNGMARQPQGEPHVFLLRYGVLEQLEEQLEKYERADEDTNGTLGPRGAPSTPEHRPPPRPRFPATPVPPAKGGPSPAFGSPRPGFRRAAPAPGGNGRPARPAPLRPNRPRSAPESAASPPAPANGAGRQPQDHRDTATPRQTARTPFDYAPPRRPAPQPTPPTDARPSSELLPEQAAPLDPAGPGARATPTGALAAPPDPDQVPATGEKATSIAAPGADSGESDPGIAIASDSADEESEIDEWELLHQLSGRNESGQS